MSAYRLSPEAEAQLDDIWLHIARDSGSVDTSIRVLEKITDCFWLLAQQPYMGRRREDLSSELRSFSSASYVILYSIESEEAILIHYVFHGNQDIESIIRH